MRVGVLAAGDEAALERFLLGRAESSMFLRSNVRAVGLVDSGARYSATYVAAWEGDEIVGVAGHSWSGMVLVQADEPAELVRAAVAATGRAVTGVGGPWAQVVATRAALGLAEAATALSSREDLFALALDQLRVPEPLAGGRWQCRRGRAEDVERLALWRTAYELESLGGRAGPELDARVQKIVADAAAWWILSVDGEGCACSAFNARLPDAVQVGGVYTPPALRGRGYARAVVAGQLVEARAGGATRAILFTGEDNVAARTAYLSLGFQIVGDYGLVLFA